MDNQDRTYNYSLPVSNLMTYGDCRNFLDWPDYVVEMGFADEHIPELIRMSLDPALNFADSESLEVWAPVHAWRALGQLRAEAAIDALMPLFHMFEDDDGGGQDWINSDLTEVYAMFGAKAIPTLTSYLEDTSHGIYARSDVSNALVQMVERFPEVRGQCVEIITKEVSKFNENSPELTAFLIADLLNLEAVESLDVIKAAFDADRVDTTIVGEFYDVQLDLGVIEMSPEIERQRKIDAEKRRRLYHAMMGNLFGDDENLSKEEYRKQLKTMHDKEKQEKKKSKAKRKQTEKMKKRSRKRK